MQKLTALLFSCIYLSLVSCVFAQHQESYSDAAFGTARAADNSKRYLNLDNPNPTDLLDTLIIDQLNQPTNIHFCPDGRMFISLKAGVVLTATDGVTSPWIDVSPDVHNMADRGLLSVACDPNYLQNGYVYLLYVQNPTYGASGLSADIATQGVIVRYTDINGVADPNSLTYIVGGPTGSATGFVICSNSHAVGDLVFGLDGTLFASSGDGSHWEWTDDGTDRIGLDATCAQYWGAAADIGAFRSQAVDIMAGKIIRVDPATGNGIGPTNFPNLLANPFFDPANPASSRSRVWTMGNRNQFRMVVRPDSNIPGGPGVLYVADVGYYDWEEINVVRESGGRYGWPCLSGADIRNEDYYALPQCATIMQNTQVPPLVYWNHWTDDFAGFTGNCAAGAVPYTGIRYPEIYQGGSNDRAVFFSDYGGKWIRVLWVDENDNMKEDKGIQFVFGISGSMAALKADPVSGDLYFVTSGPYGEIHRIVPADESVNFKPNAQIAANPMVSNVLPMTVNFSSDNTVDVDGDKLWIYWDFGDGSHSTEANPVHTYTTAGVWTVKMTVLDARGATASKTLTIKSNQAAPVATITAPANQYEFPQAIGTIDTVFTATATDADTPEDQLTYFWEIRLIHVNHYHTNAFVSEEKTFSVDLASVVSELERNTLEVYCTVTDPEGNSGTDLIYIRPAGMTNILPVTSFTLTPVQGSSMLTVVADSTSTVDADTDLMHHTWDWGDGTSYYGYDTLKAVHTYDKPGTYNVILTVNDAWDTDIVSNPQTVTVGNGEADNLALYMTFDDLSLGSGTTKDCSPNEVEVVVPEGVTGNTTALLTAGAAIEVNTPAFNNINGQLSLFVRIKFAQTNGQSTIVSNKGTNSGFELELNDKKIQFISVGADICNSVELDINQEWHQIGVIVNGTTCFIYFDGQDVTENNIITPLVGGNDVVRIGNNAEGQKGLNGEIDDLVIYLNQWIYYQMLGKVEKLESCNEPVIEPTTTTGEVTTTTGDIGTTGDNNSTSTGETSTTGEITGTTGVVPEPGSTTSTPADTGKSSGAKIESFGWSVVVMLIVVILMN